jgi:hypothetical protein
MPVGHENSTSLMSSPNRLPVFGLKILQPLADWLTSSIGAVEACGQTLQTGIHTCTVPFVVLMVNRLVMHLPFGRAAGTTKANYLVGRYAGEGEYPELLRVARGVADDGLVVSLQIFGQNVCIQEGFDHRSEHDRRARRAPSLLVSDGNNLIQ